ncbi:methyltransferase [Streptomyces sp. HNM0574]|uniref:methyltransferase n=1 Tax=Streptomyces sp. HNM0574 TaxID=2714954 RepID=UPI00146A451F|nr:methyltransferase [Streptomyces sp. HNM0574]NLU70603.1 O-methyltransferase family protein [Streptomyces sp. HNM0574]
MATDRPTPENAEHPDGADAAQQAQLRQAAQLIEAIMGQLYPAALHTAVRFRIPDLLAEHGPRTAGQLAALADLKEPNLYRILRYLATREIFREDEQGRFHLTPMAEALRADAQPPLRDFAMLLGDEMFWHPTIHLHETVRTGTPGFETAYGKTFFQHLSEVPEAAATFDAGMAGFSDLVNHAVAASYAFPPGATLADIGGGRGGLLRALLTADPVLNGVLYDLEHVVAGHRLDVPELKGRWRTEAGDFFTSVPEGCDVHLIKHVLHDWSDEDSARILRASRRALPDHGRLLVVDAVLPRDNAPHPGKTIDGLMMTLLEGKERTREQFEELFARSGYRLTRIVPTPSFACVVEAEPVAP